MPLGRGAIILLHLLGIGPSTIPPIRKKSCRPINLHGFLTHGIPLPEDAYGLSVDRQEGLDDACGVAESAIQREHYLRVPHAVREHEFVKKKILDLDLQRGRTGEEE